MNVLGFCFDQGSSEKMDPSIIYLSIYLFIHLAIICILASVIMEAGKSQYLQGELASWRPRRADGVVLVQRANDSAQV